MKHTTIFKNKNHNINKIILVYAASLPGTFHFNWIIMQPLTNILAILTLLSKLIVLFRGKVDQPTRWPKLSEIHNKIVREFLITKLDAVCKQEEKGVPEKAIKNCEL